MINPKYAAAMHGADWLRLEQEVQAFEAAGYSELHFDVSDGMFAPGFACGAQVIKAVHAVSKLPCHVHLLVSKPERYIDQFAALGCAGIAIHAEASIHPQRALVSIRNAGVSPGIAIKAATPLTKLDYLLDYVDRVLVLVTDPGCAGQKPFPTAYERVGILRKNLEYRELAIKLQVEGALTAEGVATFVAQGAELFVLEPVSIAHAGDHRVGLGGFKAAVEMKRHLV